MNVGVGGAAALGVVAGTIVGSIAGLFLVNLAKSPYKPTEVATTRAAGWGGVVGALGGAFLAAGIASPVTGCTTTGVGATRLRQSGGARGLSQLSPG